MLTWKYSDSLFASALLIPRFPLKMADTCARDPTTGASSACFKPFCSPTRRRASAEKHFSESVREIC